MITTYANPWHNPLATQYGPAEYRTEVSPTQYRGCLIYQRIAGSWDVVRDGVCLTQRAGFSGAKAAIDNMLDNPADYWAERMLGYLPTA